MEPALLAAELTHRARVATSTSIEARPPISLTECDLDRRWDVGGMADAKSSAAPGLPSSRTKPASTAISTIIGQAAARAMAVAPGLLPSSRTGPPTQVL